MSDNSQSPLATVALLDRIVERFAAWVQFGDAKAGGVLALMAIGLVDLLNHAHRLASAHKLVSDWGIVATASFWGALASAVIVVLLVSMGLFPRVKPATASAFFFGSVA